MSGFVRTVQPPVLHVIILLKIVLDVRQAIICIKMSTTVFDLKTVLWVNFLLQKYMNACAVTLTVGPVLADISLIV